MRPRAQAPLLAMVLAFAYTNAVHAQVPGTRLVLSGATIIDGTGAPPRPGMTVIVDGERIVDVFPAGTRPNPPGATVRDLRGLFIIPGLIDVHTHFGAAATTNGRLRRVLLGGVTSVRNMLGACSALQRSRQAVADSLLPDFIFTAVMFGPAGSSDPRGATRPAEAIDPDCVRMLGDHPAFDPARFVMAAKERGVSAIKFYADITPDLVRRVTTEAHRQGLAAWGHATLFPSKPSDLVRAGVDVLSHAPYLIWEAVDSLPVYHERVRLAPFSSVPVTHPAIESLLRLMAERGTILDATLLFFALRATAPDSAPADFRGGSEQFAAALKWGASVTRRARELGVVVAAGTDALGGEAGRGPNLHRELELLVNEAGFSPLQAITAATGAAARVMRTHDAVGTIAPGKQADLVVLRADPTSDIRNTSAIALIVKRGKVVDAAR